MTLKMVDIIFEDEWVLIVNKPAGLVVNRSETNSGGTLQDFLSDYFHLGDKFGIGDRAGIVHRLDRETSGLLVVAKTKAAFANLQDQFKQRDIKKEYSAMVHGLLKEDEGVVESKIARIGSFGKFGVVERRSEGRESRTDFKVEGRYKIQDKLIQGYAIGQGHNLTKARINYLKRHAGYYSLLRVFPKTGRTHQIRVHLKSIGNPVVSDLIYGPHKLVKFDLTWCKRLFLHAAYLEFIHPKTKKKVSFSLDLPKELKNAILNLEKI